MTDIDLCLLLDKNTPQLVTQKAITQGLSNIYSGNKSILIINKYFSL